MLYRLRIDKLNGLDVDEILELCGMVASVTTYHELPHGNPHYHMYIQTDIKEPALRQRLKRKFPDIKRSDYSIKKCDDDRIDEYIQYMFNTKHGNKWELIEYTNFDYSRIQTCMANAKAVTDDFAERNKKDKGPTIWDIAQEVEERFQQENKKYDNLLCHKGSGRAEDFVEDSRNEKIMIDVYMDLSIEVLRKHKKPYCEFLLRKVITTAMTVHENGKNIMRKKMYKNFCNLY